MATGCRANFEVWLEEKIRQRNAGWKGPPAHLAHLAGQGALANFAVIISPPRFGHLPIFQLSRVLADWLSTMFIDHDS